MTFGNGILFSDEFNKILFKDNKGNDISSQFSLDLSSKDDTLVIQYTGQDIDDPSIYMSNFMIENLITEVSSGNLDIYPKCVPFVLLELVTSKGNVNSESWGNDIVDYEKQKHYYH